MNYNPNIHHRRSIRLKGYDYSQQGMYFITICTQNRVCLFGEIINGEMVLNDAGRMMEKWWKKIEEKFPDIELGDFIIMPNHFHCVVVNTGVGVDPRVNPDDGEQGEHVGSPVRSSPVHAVVQWFKTMTTNEYIRGVKENIYPPFDKKIWQRNY